MSNDPVVFDDGFNSGDFSGTLPFIPITTTPVETHSSFLNGGVAGIGAMLRKDFTNGPELPDIAFSQAFDNFLTSYSGNLKNSTLGDIIQDWYGYISVGANASVFHLKTIDSTRASQSEFYQALVKEYADATAIQLDSQNHFQGGDGELIYTGANGQINGDFSDWNNPQNPLVQTFNHFLSGGSSPLVGNITPDTPSVKFFTNLDRFFTTTALVESKDDFIFSPPAINPGVPPTAYDNLPSYWKTFKAYFGSQYPDETNLKNAFIQSFTSFLKDNITKEGYFLPSHSFSEWFAKVLKDSQTSIPILKGGSLDGNSSEKALILDRILQLLIKIIGSLQQVGIAQAARLKYLTQYQQAYTTLQTQIPTFLRGGPRIGGTSDQDSRDRNDLNSSFNGQLTENLRALRGLKEDDAKRVQTNINQTNDAVNQQVDMATSFLQELSTLLSTILR
jgi:hypothetical protein